MFGYDVFVEMGEFKRASSPEIIGTIGLGPCIGIGLYDQNSKVGYVAHSMSMRVIFITRVISLYFSLIKSSINESIKNNIFSLSYKFILTFKVYVTRFCFIPTCNNSIDTC